ncbi:MAG: DNA repair protein RadC [Motiliproteus sp.]|nr:DNA repair protein RadC [Motiliproteus sp.]MCW9053538.1 DNA repair protein RadC [Motiliproteus sp.]
MAICDWPQGERPREKLLQQGAQALSDAELLAIFLRTGVAGKTAVDLSRELLNRFGTIRALLKAPEKQFCDAPGLGRAKFAQLQAVLELARRHLAEQLHRENALNSPEDTRRYVSSRLRDRDREVFAVLFLDNQHRMIAFEELFQGTIDSASVYPREVIRQALAHNAAALIFAHNHPSGIAEPSEADRQITLRLVRAAELMDLRVLDHLVVGDGEAVSFAERGWI